MVQIMKHYLQLKTKLDIPFLSMSGDRNFLVPRLEESHDGQLL